MSTLKILKYQLQDVLRSRWVLFYTGFFWLVTDALFRFGGTGERVVVSLMNVVLLVVPLVAIMLGVMFLYNSREYVELLLSQPIRRMSLFLGLYAGLTVPLSAGFAIGVVVPFLYHGGGEAASLALLVATGVLLVFVFSALAFFVALRTDDRIRGLGTGLVVWLFFAVLYDGLVLLTVVLLSQYPLEKPVIAMSLLNPVDLGRILLLLKLDISALMGYTGAVFQRFFGSGSGQAITVAALLAWVGVPFLLGRRAFLNKNF